MLQELQILTVQLYSIFLNFRQKICHPGSWNSDICLKNSLHLRKKQNCTRDSFEMNICQRKKKKNTCLVYSLIYHSVNNYLTMSINYYNCLCTLCEFFNPNYFQLESITSNKTQIGQLKLKFLTLAIINKIC